MLKNIVTNWRRHYLPALEVTLSHHFELHLIQNDQSKYKIELPASGECKYLTRKMSRKADVCSRFDTLFIFNNLGEIILMFYEDVKTVKKSVMCLAQTSEMNP